MSEHLLLAVPVLAPVAGAGLTALARRRRGIQRMVTATVLGTLVACGSWLTMRATSVGVVHTVIGSQEPLTGVAITADVFAAALVTVTGLLAAAAVTAMVAIDGDDHPLLHPALLVLLAGACGSFVAGDLFTIFVLLEVVMLASAALLVLGADRQGLRPISVYVTVNLLGTTLMLAGIAVVLARSGTVNLALLASEPGVLDDALPGAALVVLALAVKAGLLPFSGWLALAYPVARRPIMALFVGSLTTVGVAALYRVGLLVFGGFGAIHTVLLVVGTATAVLAATAAVGSSDPFRTLALVVIAQVGFMVIGLGLGTAAGVGAGVVFVVQDVLVKTAAVLAYRPLVRVGLARHRRSIPLAVFALLGLSLAGIPPLTGFLGKALLVEAAWAAGRPAVVAMSLLASALTLAAIWRLCHAAWVAPDGPVQHHEGEAATVTSVAPATLIAVVAVVVGIMPAPLLAIGEGAADTLVDPAGYHEAVLGP